MNELICVRARYGGMKETSSREVQHLAPASSSWEGGRRGGPVLVIANLSRDGGNGPSYRPSSMAAWLVLGVGLCIVDQQSPGVHLGVRLVSGQSEQGEQLGDGAHHRVAHRVRLPDRPRVVLA